MILKIARERDVRIPVVMRGADAAIGGVARIIGAAIKIERTAHFAFERAGRLAGDEIDRAAHRAGAVEHRGIALCNLHFGDVGGEEAAIIEPVVGGQIDADAVDRQWHLKAVETAHEDQPLIARAAAVRGSDAGHGVDGIVECRTVERLDRFGGQRFTADFDALRALRGDDDLAESEGGVAVLRCLFGKGGCGNGKESGDGENGNGTH